MHAGFLRLHLGLLLTATGCTGPLSFSSEIDSGSELVGPEEGRGDSGSAAAAGQEDDDDDASELDPAKDAATSAPEPDAGVGASLADAATFSDSGDGDPGAVSMPPPQGSQDDAGCGVRVPRAVRTIDDIDGYVLAHSIEQLAGLELRRGGRVVWSRTREQIQQYVPSPGPFHLTELSFKKVWLDTFWAWTYMQSSTAHADALRIAGALASYFVGVRAVTVGPECGRAVDYQRGEVSAGRPGDEGLALLEAELRRSDRGAERLGAQGGIPCITGLQAVQPAQRVAVVIDLPLDAALEVGDEGIWTGDDQNKERVGVPAPDAFFRCDVTAAGSEPPVAETHGTLSRVDSHVLRQSIEQLAQLEVRRGGATLFSRSYAEITPHLQSVPALTSLQFTRGWVDTFRSWLGAAGARADPIRISHALSAYFVGVQAISIGPECGPVSGSYAYGFVNPGVPGDDVPAKLRAEIARSEAAIDAELMSIPSTSCFTALRPNPTGNVVPQHVVIDVSSEAEDWISDVQIWSEGGGAGRRAGVPVPDATGLKRGSGVR